MNLAGDWTLPNNQQYPLGTLQGKVVDSYKLVVLLGPKNRVGARYFRLYLQNASGAVSHQPVVTGLHNQGKYPGYNWIEISRFKQQVSFPSNMEPLNITRNGLAQQLFQYLAELIPPGGHMMVEYDSPEHRDTIRSLAMGIPPIATPLGYMLFSAGCGAAFRDWYFAEGGSEGPRKLQGFKALDRRHAQIKSTERVRELETFVDQLPKVVDSELQKAARDRASVILNKLKHKTKAKHP